VENLKVARCAFGPFGPFVARTGWYVASSREECMVTFNPDVVARHPVPGVSVVSHEFLIHVDLLREVVGGVVTPAILDGWARREDVSTVFGASPCPLCFYPMESIPAGLEGCEVRLTPDVVVVHGGCGWLVISDWAEYLG